jgi:hypothetical protein
VQELSNVSVSPAQVAAVLYLDQVRAVLAMGKIGNADRMKHSAAAVKAAGLALRSGAAFEGNVYADATLQYLPSAS